MTRAHSHPEHPDQSAIRCVVLLRDAGGTPADLDASLRSRGVTPTRCTSVYAALSELCAERTPTALIVVEPEQTPGAMDLVDAATRYASHATLWRYDASSPQRLRAFAAPAAGAGGGGAPEIVVPARHARPKLRLAPADDAPPARAVLHPPHQSAPDGPARPPASLLSEDELAMLLARDEPTRGKGGGR